jgi:hypothetical protein
MTPSELLDRLVAIFPEFAAYWDAADNLFREAGGSYTVCGVFSHFTHFVREYFPSFHPSGFSELRDLIEECLQEPDTDISHAVGVCFLENMTSEQFTAAFIAQLGPRGRECMADLRGDAV